MAKHAGTVPIKNPDSEAMCQRVAKIFAMSMDHGKIEFQKWVDGCPTPPKYWELIALADRIKDLAQTIKGNKDGRV